MNEQERQTLINKVELVLKLIEQEQLRVDQQIWETIQKHYSKLKLALEENKDIRVCNIEGSVHAFLEASSNYNDPLLDALDEAECMYVEMLKCK